MKIWCEECKGTGKQTVAYSKPHVIGIEHAYNFKCKGCGGKGYNEIDLDLQEVGRNGRIALAIKTALQDSYQLQFHKCVGAFNVDIIGFDTIDELLEWEDKYYEEMK